MTSAVMTPAYIAQRAMAVLEQPKSGDVAIAHNGAAQNRNAHEKSKSHATIMLPNWLHTLTLDGMCAINTC